MADTPAIIDTWPCRKCGAKELLQESSDDEFEDYKFTCLKCGYSWWEEGIDS